MRSISVLRRKSSFRMEGWTSPAVFGLAAWLVFPAVPSNGDLTDLFAGFDRDGAQWRMVMTNSPAGSIHNAELAFPNARDAGIQLPDGRKVAFVGSGDSHTEKDNAGDGTTDEERVNRATKKGRVMAVERMLPPKAFTAGSVLQRTSYLFSKPEKGSEKVAFVKPKKGEKTVELAAFYFRKKEDKLTDGGMNPMIAKLVTNTNPDILATAYAPAKPDYSRQSPFDAILNDKPAAGRFVPEIGPKDHAWAATALPALAFSPKEQQCLASGIYFEARGESVKGQAAVAQVILNRVRNPAYPDTVCGVVYQNEDWRNRCQFSFACDNIKDRIRSEEHWKMAREVAMAVTAGKIWLPEVGSATHYHAVYVRPKWARTMQKVGRIGLHVFYRTYGGGWS